MLLTEPNWTTEKLIALLVRIQICSFWMKLRGRHLQKKGRLQGCEDEVCYNFYSFILFALCFLISIVFFLPSKMVECSWLARNVIKKRNYWASWTYVDIPNQCSMAFSIFKSLNLNIVSTNYQFFLVVQPIIISYPYMHA